MGDAEVTLPRSPRRYVAAPLSARRDVSSLPFLRPSLVVTGLGGVLRRPGGGLIAAVDRFGLIFADGRPAVGLPFLLRHQPPELVGLLVGQPGVVPFPDQGLKSLLVHSVLPSLNGAPACGPPIAGHGRTRPWPTPDRPPPGPGGSPRDGRWPPPVPS